MLFRVRYSKSDMFLSKSENEKHNRNNHIDLKPSHQREHTSTSGDAKETKQNKKNKNCSFAQKTHTNT
jgi:hypothetical protein